MNIIYFLAFIWRAFDGFKGLGYHLRDREKMPILFDFLLF
jgi:hypothetical protein